MRRSTKSARRPNPSMDKLMRINQQYAQLLQKLAPSGESGDASPQAQLFSTLQHLRELNSTMKQELSLCDNFTSGALDQLLQRWQLGNVGNLIGRYEQLSNLHATQMTKSATRGKPCSRRAVKIVWSSSGRTCRRWKRNLRRRPNRPPLEG